MRRTQALRAVPTAVAWLLAASACGPLWAAEPEPFEEQNRAALMGMGSGMASGAIATGRPVSVQKAPPPFHGVIHSYQARGVKIAVLMVDSGRAGLPLSVEISGSRAIRRVSKVLAELTPGNIRVSYGQPAREAPGVVYYAGMSEACDVGVELRFSDEALTGVKWTFCVD